MADLAIRKVVASESPGRPDLLDDVVFTYPTSSMASLASSSTSSMVDHEVTDQPGFVSVTHSSLSHSSPGSMPSLSEVILGDVQTSVFITSSTLTPAINAMETQSSGTLDPEQLSLYHAC